MALWILNPGADDDGAAVMLEKNVVAIGWPELPDLTPIEGRDALLAQYRRCFPEVRGARMVSDVGQIHAFAHHARRGDLVLVPLREAMPIAVGEIVGDYNYRGDIGAPLPHTREVRWLDGDMALGDFEAELRGALETPLWFCRVQRRGVEEELRRLLDERQGDLRKNETDVDWLARRQIVARLDELSGGGRLPAIVTAILELRGLQRRPVSDLDGGDGDRQFVASESPSVVRLQLAVHAVTSRVEERELADFAARVVKQGAEQGLFVAWPGLAAKPRGAAAELPSAVHVWTREDVLEALLTVYEHLPRDLQAEIPLKRIWTLES